MLTSLDWLIIVFMGLAALALFSLSLMFLIKNQKVKKVFFYIVAVLGIYLSSIAIRIGLGGMFTTQITVGFLTALAGVGAVITQIVCKDNKKGFLIAQMIATASLVIGFINAFLL